VTFPSDFILYAGAIEPRKNVDRSIEIFAELIKDKKYEHYKYYIIGRAGWKNEHVFALIKKLHLDEKVIFLGFVPHEHLPHFYNAASALMYLSSYEGFGLPPLEAAACGTPTLLYQNSSLIEIMPTGYEFAKKGSEVTTLTVLIENKSRSIQNVVIPTWVHYADRFIHIIEENRHS
jgi:glycosyltransferase involved in cell wall biosynthesis